MRTPLTIYLCRKPLCKVYRDVKGGQRIYKATKGSRARYRWGKFPKIMEAFSRDWTLEESSPMEALKLITVKWNKDVKLWRKNK